MIVNGTAGNDFVTVDQLTLDGARVMGLGPTINVATAEHLIFNGRGGTSDALVYITPAGPTVNTFTPGVGPESGTISSIGGSIGLLGLTFTDAGASGAIRFQDVSGGRADVLYVRGTDVDDRFNVSPAGDVQIFDASNTFFKTKSLQTSGINFLRLQGLAGDDAFFIPGGYPFSFFTVEGRISLPAMC